MAKQEDDLGQKASDWLSKEGYRLEYLTYEAFRNVGITAVMSNYVASREGKLREIDVSAFQSDLTESSFIEVTTLCECKYSTDKPWVLMLSGLPADLFADWHSLPKSKNLQEHSHKIVQFKNELEKTWHFAEDQRFAHSLLQAFRGQNRDAAFDSLQKISYAAWDSVEVGKQRDYPAYLVAIPCIIVEAPLFASRFDSAENRFLVESVPYGRISWAGCRGGTVVDVVQASSLKDYAQAIKITFNKILSVIKHFAEMAK